MECDGDDMAVHNVGGPERRANAPLAQMVRAFRVAGSSPAGSTFHP